MEKSSLVTFRNGLPTSSEIFIEEIERLLANRIIERYGREEFERIILTHEIHGHIGAYTVIGAKMGVFASELLKTPRRSMKVISEAWKGELPIRCLNDGIMTATGCTPSHGNLEIDPNGEACAARFVHGDKILRLELKEEYHDRLRKKISDAMKRYRVDGVLTAPYWKEVLDITWWVWEDWDRREIFDVRWLSG